MNKYNIIYEIHNGEFPTPLEQQKIICTENIEEAMYKIKEECNLNYMCCEIISIKKEN